MPPISPFWRTLAPTLPPAAIDLAAGHYAMTPDHKPLIGPALETAGLWLHTGYSGHGIMGSPSGARLLADPTTGRLAPEDNPFRPDRFAAGLAVETEAMLLWAAPSRPLGPLARRLQHRPQPTSRRPRQDPARMDDTDDRDLGFDGANRGGTGNGAGPRDAIALARRALEPIQQSLTEAGFYAYGMVDDQNRWTVAADDEAGRVDVRVGPDGFVVELWASSPGLYADEENEFRRRALERLARMTIPNVARGFLQHHQSASWDEVDQGIAVRLRYELPFTRAADVGPFVRAKLPELGDLLGFVETQVTS